MTTGGYLALTLALATASCAASPRPCANASGCPGGACQAGRCAQVGDVPVPAGARRAVVSANAVRASVDARYVASFGGAAGSPTLFVRFPPAWGRGKIERAFLVLTPAPGAPSTRGTTTITVARALEPWTATSSEPRVGAVEASATIPFAGGRVIRVDVTDAVREWARTGDAHEGFVVRGWGEGGVGAAIAVEADEPPRLDVYVLEARPLARPERASLDTARAGSPMLPRQWSRLPRPKRRSFPSAGSRPRSTPRVGPSARSRT